MLAIPVDRSAFAGSGQNEAKFCNEGKGGNGIKISQLCLSPLVEKL